MKVSTSTCGADKEPHLGGRKGLKYGGILTLEFNNTTLVQEFHGQSSIVREDGVSIEQ